MPAQYELLLSAADKFRETSYPCSVLLRTADGNEVRLMRGYVFDFKLNRHDFFYEGKLKDLRTMGVFCVLCDEYQANFNRIMDALKHIAQRHGDVVEIIRVDVTE